MEWLKQHVRGSMPKQSIDYYENTDSSWRNEEAIGCVAAKKKKTSRNCWNATLKRWDMMQQQSHKVGKVTEEQSNTKDSTPNTSLQISAWLRRHWHLLTPGPK
jgi:hypothetical protein